MAVARPTKDGWLHKEGGATKSKWQLRWFVLRGDTLSYYQKKEAASEQNGTPLGSINLTEVDDVSKIGEHSGKDHCLAIIGVKNSNKKVYYLAADHIDVLTEWFIALKAASNSNRSQKLTKYCTAEIFLNRGIRINGDVNYHILTVLSMRTSPERKHRDHLGWFCDREVALSTVLNLFAQYSWIPDKIYRSSAYSPVDNGIHPAIRVIFSKPPKTLGIENFKQNASVAGGCRHPHYLEHSKTVESEPPTLAGLGDNVLEGADDELIELMQEFDIPLTLLMLNSNTH